MSNSPEALTTLSSRNPHPSPRWLELDSGFWNDFLVLLYESVLTGLLLNSRWRLMPPGLALLPAI